MSNRDLRNVSLVWVTAKAKLGKFKSTEDKPLWEKYEQWCNQIKLFLKSDVEKEKF